MGGRPKAAWKVVYLSYPCPTCGAAPGQVCLTINGRKSDPHAARTRDANRCPRCGAITVGEAGPGALCDRCALVRALEVERATKWKRRDP